MQQGVFHNTGRLLFQGQLGMTVGALQERGISVPRQLRHRLLVYPVVQEGGDEVVPEGVKVVFFWETEFLIDHSEMLGEGARVEE